MDKKLTLGKDGVFGGVCSGLADYFEIDVAFSRILMAFIILASGGSGLLAYFVLWLAMPDHP